MNTLQNTIPSTADMKAMLEQVMPSAPSNFGGTVSETVADIVAISAAGVVTGVADLGSGTLTFADRISTRYKFQRALATGKLQLAVPAPATTARATRPK